MTQPSREKKGRRKDARSLPERGRWFEEGEGPGKHHFSPVSELVIGEKGRGGEFAHLSLRSNPTKGGEKRGSEIRCR